MNDSEFWISWYKRVLLSPLMLGTLVVINGLGTIYGFIWYDAQLISTWETHAKWLIVFVPDSPTASLFFTIAICLLWCRVQNCRIIRPPSYPESVIAAVAVVSSMKYGLWAVSMIGAGNWLGSSLTGPEVMLIFSHLGMAIEAVIYMRFFGYRLSALVIAAVWVLVNDILDYSFGIYPWLPWTLRPFESEIAIFTVGLSVLCILFATWGLNKGKRDQLV